jgi:hypothetical protein
VPKTDTQETENLDKAISFDQEDQKKKRGLRSSSLSVFQKPFFH